MKMTVDASADLASEPVAGRLASTLGVRANEIAIVRAMFVGATLLGFALVFFFSASNALFLVDHGIDRLPWVYIVNAPIVVAAGLLYSAWSRRVPVASVLAASTVIIALSVIGLWLWVGFGSNPTSSFALATWYRFLFVFSVLGLWEVASAQFDVRQAKRLFPVVAVGMMLAFMIGGALVSPLVALVGTEHLVGVSGFLFLAYALVFSRTVATCNFDEADNAVPATPVEIVRESFSRNLAIMRSITILLIFVTEFIFYEQVAATFETQTSIARFLGIFLAVATLAMVIVTALVSGKYIARRGIRIGLMTMPAGLMVCALLIGLYGAFRGTDTFFFALVVFANFASMVLANAIETPVGAVLYQPMSADRRMPVRVAVDGWLGSVALLAAGLMLLAFDALSFGTVVPFAWLLAAIGALGIFTAGRLFVDYQAALTEATTLAFAGSGDVSTLEFDVDAVRGAVGSRLSSDDPAAVLAAVGLANELGDDPLRLMLPALIDNRDPAIAAIGIDAMLEVERPDAASKLASVAADESRLPVTRAHALRGLVGLDSSSAGQVAHGLLRRTDLDPLTSEAIAVDVAVNDSQLGWSTLNNLAGSSDPEDRVLAAAAVSVVPTSAADDPKLADLALAFLRDPDLSVAAGGVAAAAGRLSPDMIEPLLRLGHRPDHRRSVVETLASDATVDVSELLDPLTDNLPERYAADIIDEVHARRTRRPTLLHRFVKPAAPSRIRRAGFDALRVADVNPPATTARMVADDLAFIRLAVSAFRDCASLPLMVDALTDEFEVARSAIHAALRLDGNAKRLVEIEAIITQIEDEEGRANGIEALDTVLPTELRLMVIPALEPASIADAAETIGELDGVEQPVVWATRIAENPRFAATTRALAEYYRCDDAAHDEKKAGMSAMIERILALKRIDIFASLPYDLLTELASIASELSVQAGHVVIAAGDFGDELYALTDGAVVVDGVPTTTLHSGAVVGELAVLAPAPRSATVTASTDCDFLVVNRKTLLALTARRPEVMAEIAKVLATRLQATKREPLPERS